MDYSTKAYKKDYDKMDKMKNIKLENIQHTKFYNYQTKETRDLPVAQITYIHEDQERFLLLLKENRKWSFYVHPFHDNDIEDALKFVTSHPTIRLRLLYI